MTVRSLGWLAVRTPAADAMNTFYRDVLHLEVILEWPGETWFRPQDGTEVHVDGLDDDDHEFFRTAPVVGLAVDSFRAAHAALAMARVEFSILSRIEPTAMPGSISARPMATSTRSSDLTTWATWPRRPRGPAGAGQVRHRRPRRRRRD